jgi:hypothetical protein
MTHSDAMPARLWICMNLAVASFGCRAAPSSMPRSAVSMVAVQSTDDESANATKRSGAPPTSPVRLGTRWLDALRARDEATLQSLSGYPFEFRDTGAETSCNSGTAHNVQQLLLLLRCRNEASLMDAALTANPAPAFTVTSTDRLPEWGRAWRSEVVPGSTAVTTDLPDNGVTYALVIFVDHERVNMLWRHVEFWPN